MEDFRDWASSSSKSGLPAGSGDTRAASPNGRPIQGIEALIEAVVGLHFLPFACVPRANALPDSAPPR